MIYCKICIVVSVIDKCFYYHYCYLLGERNFSFTLVGSQEDLLFESGSEISIKGLYQYWVSNEMLTSPQLNKADYLIVLLA